MAHLADLEQQSPQGGQRTLDINLNGVMLGTQAAIARMKGKGGSIVNMASIEGLLGEAALPAYNAAKGGVRIFSRSVAIHCARSGYNIRRSEEHTSELQSLMRISYAVFCLKKKKQT